MVEEDVLGLLGNEKRLGDWNKSFRENEKTFGDFLDVRKSFSTTHPGVSQNTTPV